MAARRTVTVVFSDIANSTPLGDALDPEVMRGVMEQYYFVVRQELERHGGTVEKFIGDAVMAVFGIPKAHDDDALRAVRAAVDMRTALGALNQELEHTHNVRLAIRTGVNTGEVVAGDPTDRQSFATGAAVATTQRLEAAARSGEILLGDSTYRLVSNAVLVEPMEPLSLKGKAKPVKVWRLLGVVEGAPPFPRRLDTPMVGRVEELAALHGELDVASRERRCRLATVVGPAGIGKSKLGNELFARTRGAATTLVGRCLAYGEGITYWPLAEIVRGTAGADREAIGAVARDEVAADRVAAAIGVGGVAGTKEETQWGARRYLEALAAELPLVVVLDDLHWAETTFLDLVEYVADFASAPILLLCTARPDLLDARPAWTAPRPNAIVVALEPLADDDAATLAGGVDEQTRRRILEVAEGNPLFVEQLAALRADRGEGLAIPPTMQALLAARIDSLAAPERIVVERASVEGRLFHRGSVVELTPEPVRPDVGSHLLALVRKEFVRPDRAELPGDDGYRFVHALVRDAAYQSMAKELRAELHGRFATWLERVAAERLGELDAILGYHLEQAALYRRELGLPDENDAGRRAAELLARAGTRAYDRGDFSAAENLLGRAVSLLPEGDPVRVRALPLLGATILNAAGGMERTIDVLERALEESRLAGDRGVEASAWALHGVVRMLSDPGADMGSLSAELEARTPEVEQLADVRALVCLRRLELQVAIATLRDLDGSAERLLAASRGAGDRPSAFEALLFLSAALAIGPMPVDDALAVTRDRLRALADGPVEEAAVEQLEGLLRGMRGEFDEGRRLEREARATYAEFGMKLNAVASARNAALIERYAGDAAAAGAILRAACDELRAAGETGYLSTELGELADALYELGRYEEAEEACAEAKRLTQHIDVVSQVNWRRVRAKVLARRGESGDAARLAREAVEWAETTDALEVAADAYLDLAEVERLSGRPDAAAEALGRALAAYERKGLVPMAERARRELAELR